MIFGGEFEEAPQKEEQMKKEMKERVEALELAIARIKKAAFDAGAYFWNAFGGDNNRACWLVRKQVGEMEDVALRTACAVAFREIPDADAAEISRNSPVFIFRYGGEEARKEALKAFSLDGFEGFLGSIYSSKLGRRCGDFSLRSHYSPTLGESIAFIVDVEYGEDEEGNAQTFEWTVGYVSLRDFSKWEFPTQMVGQPTIDHRKAMTDMLRNFRDIFAAYGTTEEEFLASHPRITSDDPRSLEQIVEDSCKEFEAYRHKIAEEFFPHGY